MSARRMHADQLRIDEPLVRRLLVRQFPAWAGLSLHRVASTGTENALFRLGDELVVRLPLRPGKETQVDKDHRWLPTLAPQLPLPIPTPVARGAPCKAYPSPWSVCRWLAGEEASLEGLDDPCQAARDLAGFVHALQGIDPSDGPAPGQHNFQRGVPLRDRDAVTRASIARCAGLIDTAAVKAATTWRATRRWLAPPGP